MRPLALLLALAVLLSCPACDGCGGCGGCEEAASLPNRVDWSRTDPEAFLDLLVEHPGTTFSVTTPPPAGWITADDVEALMARIDSRKPAALVCSASGAYEPRDATSTEGREALFLIEGLREGSYPPRLCSVHYFHPDLEEYRTWWVERRRLGY